jgi:hypothetical protein
MGNFPANQVKAEERAALSVGGHPVKQRGSTRLDTAVLCTSTKVDVDYTLERRM